MKLRVDPGECMGHGRCYRLAPGLLSDDDEGYVSPRGSDIEVRPEHVELAREVADTCPEGAIVLIED